MSDGPFVHSLVTLLPFRRELQRVIPPDDNRQAKLVATLLLRYAGVEEEISEEWEMKLKEASPDEIDEVKKLILSVLALR